MQGDGKGTLFSRRRSSTAAALVVDIHPNVAYLPSECEHTQHISHVMIQR